MFNVLVTTVTDTNVVVTVIPCPNYMVAQKTAQIINEQLPIPYYKQSALLLH